SFRSTPSSSGFFFLSLYFFSLNENMKQSTGRKLHTYALTLSKLSYSQTQTRTHSLHSKRAPFVLADALILVET
mgnify:CR=1